MQMIVPKKRTLAIEDCEIEEEKITDIFDNIELININFNKCVKGYHLINTSPINETIWEDVNAVIFKKSSIEILSKSDGSHLSGMDIHCSLGKISNKSAKYEYSKHKKIIKISSYRLTCVCSDKHCGTPTDFIEEIEKRNNYDYYSIIVREESDGLIYYDWLFIPSNCEVLNPAAYHWEPAIGTKKKDSQVGWKTNMIRGCSMSIRFSMSSQLWIHLDMAEMNKFIIASATVENKSSFDYIDLVDKLNFV